MKRLLDLLVACLFWAGPAWLMQGCTPKQANDFVDQSLQAFYGQVVTVPRRDTTPPIATLKIPDLGSGAKTLVTGQSDITIPITPKQSPFFVIGVADDPEGVKEVDLFGGGNINCNNGQGVGSTTFVDFPNGVVASDASPAKAGGTATNRRTIIHQVDLDEWTSCPDPNFHVTSVTISLQAGGTNFSGLKALSPTVTFSYKP